MLFLSVLAFGFVGVAGHVVLICWGLMLCCGCLDLLILLVLLFGFDNFVGLVGWSCGLDLLVLLVSCFGSVVSLDVVVVCVCWCC